MAGETLHRSEWRASTFTTSSQAEAALAVAPDGTILTVWSSRRQNGGRYGVYAQRFGADGIAVGEETALSLWSQSHQSAPDVAVDASGRAWVVWQSHGQDGEAGAIIARRFDSSFAGGSEILVNQEWLGEQIRPVVACAPDGRALMVWMSTPGLGTPTQVCARLLDADGRPLTDEIAVSAGDSPQQNNTPAVAAHPRGGFAVAWAVADEAGVPAGIRLARIDADGQRDAETVDITDTDAPSQIEPVLSATSDGYVVAWLDAASDGFDYGVVARRLDTQGCPRGGPFVVTPEREGTQNGVAIAVASDDGFVIAYNDADADGRGIFAQRFGPDAVPAGEPFRINRHTEGRQSLHAPTATRRLAFTPSGALVAAWSGDAGDGDSSSVNVTLLSPKPLELAGVMQGVTASMQPAGFHAESGGQVATPHQPPTFDPKRRAHGVREIRVGADPGFTAIFNTGWTPPDPHLAVGPDHVVVMTNGAIAFFTKDGQLTFQDEIEGSQGFWGSVGASGFIFDPEVLYDPMSGRFFAMAADDAGSTSWACVAVSDDSDPNGSWHKYRFNTSSLAGGLFDSPNIGVDDEAVYITGDGFGLGANYPIFIYDKASLRGRVQHGRPADRAPGSAGIALDHRLHHPRAVLRAAGRPAPDGNERQAGDLRRPVLVGGLPQRLALGDAPRQRPREGALVRDRHQRVARFRPEPGAGAV
ncbi:MAG: hypothetical protein ACYS0D_02955, partial [Planctomycetota bacterium]